MGLAQAGSSDTLVLYVRGQEGVDESALLEVLAEIEPLQTTVLSDGSVEVKLSLSGTSPAALREKISRLNGVMQVGEMNLAAPVETPAGVTVPGIDDAATTSVAPTTPSSQKQLSSAGAWWVLGVVGIVSALGGGYILLDDVRRRHRRRQLEAAFDEEPPAV